MNYRHGYHAGNFADVIKHIALVAILLHLQKKDKGVHVIDTHAGRGLYDLRDTRALATGEAAGGIARLEDLSGDVPEALRAYLDAVRQVGKQRYPGSPLIAANLLRPQDRLTVVEKHPEEVAILEDVLAPFANASVEEADGYARLLKLLPPPTRRGLAVIDPPFEATDEFTILAGALRGAIRKFATGIFLVWYPIKSTAAADGFVGEALAEQVGKALTVEIALTQQSEKLNRAGLLVINPPHGFKAEMDAIAVTVAPRLDARITTVWRAGSE